MLTGPCRACGRGGPREGSPRTTVACRDCSRADGGDSAVVTAVAARAYYECASRRVTVCCDRISDSAGVAMALVHELVHASDVRPSAARIAHASYRPGGGRGPWACMAWTACRGWRVPDDLCRDCPRRGARGRARRVPRQALPAALHPRRRRRRHHGAAAAPSHVLTHVRADCWAWPWACVLCRTSAPRKPRALLSTLSSTKPRERAELRDCATARPRPRDRATASKALAGATTRRPRRHSRTDQARRHTKARPGSDLSASTIDVIAIPESFRANQPLS